MNRESMLQISQSDVVLVRRARWRVADVRAYEACRLLTLRSLEPATAGLERRILVPFDLPEPVARRTRPARVSCRRWRRACRGLVAAETPPGALRCARKARIDLLPHQLAPALAIVRGLGSRVLLADGVGLGKTIQAGLILSELRALGTADRCLIVTPAGLRDQWANELHARFDIEPEVLDMRALRRLLATSPIGVNPWDRAAAAIVSVDFIKRPEVLAAAGSCRWDAVVVDEAHDVAGNSDRHAAVSALADRASYVVLLTATPHSGDRHAFASLCAIGGNRQDLLVFRRSRGEVPFGTTRRIHRLNVRLGDEEVRMHDLLMRFSREVRERHGNRPGRACWLALSVLHKRALSSARALSLSIHRRLAVLGSDGEEDTRQLPLPLGDSVGELDPGDEVPVWSPLLSLGDVDRERRLLGALGAAAAKAARHESKIAVLTRLLRRVAEPAVVFTEYRDTLMHLETSLGLPSALLHGGLTRHERRLALERFTSGGVRLLLATDTAGQGLNLQGAARLVVNLELPWNPTRLEQRIGRVDRIGQRRTVHAVHFVARHTAESEIFERLRRRISTARFDISAADPLGIDDDVELARRVLGRAAATRPDAKASVVRFRTPALSREAEAEASRTAWARRYTKAGDEAAVTDVEGTGPLMAATRRWRTRVGLGGRALAIWQLVAEDDSGRRIGSMLVACALRDWTRLDEPGVVDLVAGAASLWRERLTDVHLARIGTSLRREMSRQPESIAAGSQLGLFDGRAERTHRANAVRRESDIRESRERLAALERARSIAFAAPQLMLVLVP